MQAKLVTIQKRPFLRGKTECGCCEHKFKFLLPVEVVPFWEQLCSSCSLAVPEHDLKPGEIHTEPLWERS